MSTLEKMWQDADRFAKQFGLENEYTIKLYQTIEDAEKFLSPTAESKLTEEVWNKLYSHYETLNYQKMLYEGDWDED